MLRNCGRTLSTQDHKSQEAIRHQKTSEDIRRHQKTSEDIRRHQKTSEDISTEARLKFLIKSVYLADALPLPHNAAKISYIIEYQQSNRIGQLIR